MRSGLTLTAIGGAIDVAYHLSLEASGPSNELVALGGHLVTLVGMVVTMIGLVVAARRGAVRPRSPIERS
jgi:hypothetical protein